MLEAQRYSATMAPRIMIMQQLRRSIANDIHHTFLTIFRLFTKPQSFACQFITLTVTVPAEAAISRLPDASGQPHAGEIVSQARAGDTRSILMPGFSPELRSRSVQFRI